MKYFLCLTFGLLMVSCGNDRRDKLSGLVKEWQGKQIVFPEKMSFYVYGDNPVDFRIPDAEYKVLIYTDSIGCTSCKLRLGEWKDFIHEADSVTGGRVQFLFFFHTKDKNTVIDQLKAFRMDRPVCFDTSDHLNRLNRFPADSEFQTFLIDKNNHVKVIGNPTGNQQIKSLYLKLLSKERRATGERSSV